MTNYNRIGNKWSVNEVLSLQREYELLGWDIERIAKKHGRTPNAIMYKLDQEGIADYNVLYYNYHNSNEDEASQICLKPSDDNESHDEELVQRVSNLESELHEIKHMLKTLIKSYITTTKTTQNSLNRVISGSDH